MLNTATHILHKEAIHWEIVKPVGQHHTSHYESIQWEIVKPVVQKNRVHKNQAPYAPSKRRDTIILQCQKKGWNEAI